MVFDFVSDLGADPSGETVSDGALLSIDSMDGPFEVEFPDGEYRFSDRTFEVSGRAEKRLYAGRYGDPTIVAPEGYAGTFLSLGGNLRVEDIDIDRSHRTAGSTVSIDTGRRVELSNVDLIGPDNTGFTTGPFLDIKATERGASVRVSGLSARNARRAGIKIGSGNIGSVSLSDVRVEEHDSYGLDCRNTNGSVSISESVFKNNDEAQLRLGGPDTSVSETVATVDPDGASGDVLYTELNGIEIDRGEEWIYDERSGPSISNSIVTVCPTRDRSDSIIGDGIVLSERALRTELSRSTVAVHANNRTAITADVPFDNRNAEQWAVMLDRVFCVGFASEGTAVSTTARPTRLLDCCVEEPLNRRALSTSQRYTELFGTSLTDVCPVRTVALPTPDISYEPPDDDPYEL